MFEAFSIINLIDQKDAVNCAIQENMLTREDVLYWLQWYGTVKLLLYSERTILTPRNIDQIAFSSINDPKHLFTYRAWFGYFDVFNFSKETSQLEIMSRGWNKSFKY